MIKRPSGRVEWAAAFLLCLGLMLWIEFAGPAILDNDGYYHIRWSQLLRESAPHLPEFRWMPLTILQARDYVDHHFLFHGLLTPFTFGDLRIGAKVAAPIFAAIAMSATFAILIAYRIRYRWLWLIVLAGSSEAFLYRMSMTRAPSVALVFLCAASYLMLERKLRWLAALTFAFVWLYSMFPLVIFFALAYAATMYAARRKLDLAPLWASGLGAVLGLVINPYFPKNVVLIVQHVRMLLSGAASIDAGVEWDPYETWDFLMFNAPIVIVFFAALIAFNFRKRFGDWKPLFFLILSTAFLILTLRWRRFLEYWIPFSVIFAACTFAAERPAMRLGRLARAGLVLLGLAMCAEFVVNVRAARKEISSEQDPATFRGASEWLAAHSPEGSVVFNTSWDHFPMLFYYNQHNAYVTGLDPRYLFEAHPDLWKLYDRITSGDEKHAARIIRERFGAEYVVVENDSNDFLNATRASGEFETAYSDAHVSVLRARP